MSRKTTALLILLFVFFLIDAYVVCAIICIIILCSGVKKTPKIEQKPQKRRIPEQTPIDNEAINAMACEIEAMIDNERQIRMETDLRQFKGRNDVTRVELADYMFEQRYWDGLYERHLQMEEISKVCNITESDIEWVVNELEHYHPHRAGTFLGDEYPPNQNVTLDHWVCLVRSEEQKAIWEYRNEQARIKLQKDLYDTKQRYEESKRIFTIQNDTDKEFLKFLEDNHQKNLRYMMLEMRRCNYDAWLRLKGYA